MEMKPPNRSQSANDADYATNDSVSPSNASNRMIQSFNEYDWVSAAKTAASGAATMFNCAIDTTTTVNANTNAKPTSREMKDEFFDNGELILSPTSRHRQLSELTLPKDIARSDDDAKQITPDLERASSKVVQPNMSLATP